MLASKQLNCNLSTLIKFKGSVVLATDDTPLCLDSSDIKPRQFHADSAEYENLLSRSHTRDE